MKLEIKSYLNIPPETEYLNNNQLYPGYIEMTRLEDVNVFNYEFGRSGGYPGGKVIFCVDEEPLFFNANVFELYSFWFNLVLTLLPVHKSIEKQNYSAFYADEHVVNHFKITIFYHENIVKLTYDKQDAHYTKEQLGTFSLDTYKKAVLQGFLDFMWHTNLEFEAITHDSLGDEIDYIDLREDKDAFSELYACRYIFLQFMKEMYKQKSYDLDKLIYVDFDTNYHHSKLKYDVDD
ncbi:hypothetical protein [Kurthia massiliensis]|uniref:hypothetical protein n=1 Tax=Kurthia massiliensis TaxID=1033739 RepID=UPI000287F856|nr:hypothetical protein [Kurthia massiliensis]